MCIRDSYYVTCPNDFTVIVAVTENGSFLMERLYRPGAEMIMTEPPDVYKRQPLQQSENRRSWKAGFPDNSVLLKFHADEAVLMLSLIHI